jgi:hypothetical protein
MVGIQVQVGVYGSVADGDEADVGIHTDDGELGEAIRGVPVHNGKQVARQYV